MIATIGNVNREVAERLSLSEELVKKINKFYWKSLRQSISSGLHTSIWIKGFGTLVISREKIRKKIRILIARIRRIEADPKEFKTRTKLQVLTDTRDELKILLQRRNDIAIIYKENTQRYRDKLNNKQHDSRPEDNMGEQTSNSSWFSE